MTVFIRTLEQTRALWLSALSILITKNGFKELRPSCTVTSDRSFRGPYYLTQNSLSSFCVLHVNLQIFFEFRVSGWWLGIRLNKPAFGTCLERGAVQKERHLLADLFSLSFVNRDCCLVLRAQFWVLNC